MHGRGEQIQIANYDANTSYGVLAASFKALEMLYSFSTSADMGQPLQLATVVFAAGTRT